MHKFYGADNCGIKDGRGLSPADYYDILSGIWCEYTCAPRMRKDWSENNRTLGQCSVTAFLMQDFFGGDVLGIPQKDGSFHCFNAVGGAVFDLTSEQFSGEVPDYEKACLQHREDHFSDPGKKARYEYLRSALCRALQDH